MQNQESTATVSNTSLKSKLAGLGLQVQETMTTPSRPGKKPRPVWVVSGNTFGLDSFFRDLEGRKFRGQWSFFENPENAIFENLKNGERFTYAEQVEKNLDRKFEKAARYEAYAVNAEARAENSYKRANSIGSMIPMGQPVLVGHHSEKCHRRDLVRIDSSMQKSIEESRKAEYYSDKASRLASTKSKLENREFIGNRIEEAKSETSQLEKWCGPDNPRLIQAQEKLNYWRARMAQVENMMKEHGRVVPSPETIKIGDLIKYLGWYPVVRVNKKTVTISHWLGVETFTYKIPYSRIRATQPKP